MSKLNKSRKDPELYYYFNATGEKLWCYRHKYYDNVGRRKEKKKSGFKTEKEAYKTLLEIKASTLRGETKQVDYDNMSVSEWLDIWFETHQNEWKLSTAVTREHIIRLHIKPAIGHYKLQKLDKTTYRRVFINPLLKKWKVNTVKAYHNIFKIAINAAVDEEILIRNRFNKITLTNLSSEKGNSAEENYLTTEELNKLLETTKQHADITTYTATMLLAYSGVRCGELLGLTWDDIDLDEKTINVNKTRDQWGTRSPKTANSYRTILIDNVLVQQLEAYKKWCRETLFRFGISLNKGHTVFITNRIADPVTNSYVNQKIRELIKLAKVKKITVHGLRHTHATILINKNANVKAIAERLGNTPGMIYNVYGHVFKELEEESVKLFSSSLEESGAKSGASSK
ncbi:tyrosine-type recombinase/integrase [Gracilibacillus massiliensis]|uniref:tyrosine-type recombinase/integrase n=1 Tax=Gracilibacillus massiliensis TaxID=1564956 RepID=UPI00071C5156|nr:tyrosine-type recombinase/integrase [Gracilibacillus massiliensis]